jgi:ATP/maltotriose-dependent transcriptional regulator MalT
MSRAGLLPVFVHVSIAAGDLEAAREASVELDEIVAGYSNPEHAAAALSTRGRLQLAEGDAAAACATLRSAVERWRDLNVPYEVATARTLLGQALRDLGDGEAATESFAAAAQLFDQIGARLDAQALVDGAPTPALPAGLTEREVEVLQLVASGLTNNEIAGELYLSAKTVSRHLSNIFTKIGVTSRAGATAFAFEHGLVQSRS